MSENDQRIREAVDEVLKDTRVPDAARYALAFLFPKAEEALKTFIRAGSTDASHRMLRRRVSIEDFAPAYFRMDPQRATWGRSEIERILNHDEPSVALSQVEERLRGATDADRPRLRRLFLEQLRAFFDGRPITESWLGALVGASPGFIAARDATAKYLFEEDNADRLRRIVYQGLRPLEVQVRANIVKNVIPSAADISLLCDIMRLIAGDIRPNTAEREPRTEVTFGEETAAVRELLLARVRQFAASGRIWEQVRPDRLLWFWWGSVLDDEVKNFTEETLESDSGIRALFDIPVQLVRSTAGDYEHVGSEWSHIIDIERLAEIAASWLADPNRSGDERRLAERYLAAFKRKDRL